MIESQKKIDWLKKCMQKDFWQSIKYAMNEIEWNHLINLFVDICRMENEVYTCKNLDETEDWKKNYRISARSVHP